ncbi:MAG: recombination mediator RecR [Bacteroidales bacterium]|nr:recombination mediator RecR [Bacteroidales bacterium]MCF8343095.1 recombination mediator RecR [Bacteroidales bacterium]MCF8375357.1 recombination mediator RecR [Bacteroidales bacterium]MCF8400213.1 recombination mediator RecR [Bacteroidales bacterium]
MNTYSSKLLEQAVNELSRLPGIGRRTALRLALHLLRQEKEEAESLGNSLIKMRNEIVFCKHCHNISDNEVCDICASPKRDNSLICVVEDTRDVMAVENTSQYQGLYHVLGGIISPMEGIGPNDLNIGSLVKRISEHETVEVILALPTTVEGDTTNYFIYKKLKDFNISISTIARGISIGDELEYADEVTLGRSILNRTPFFV